MLNLTVIPVWEIDDEDERWNWDRTLVRCYDARSGERIKIRDVVRGARKSVHYGLKGTKHVALVARDGREVPLERVTPRIAWGDWIRNSTSMTETLRPDAQRKELTVEA